MALVARLSSPAEVRWQRLVAGQVRIAKHAIEQWKMQQSRIAAGCNGRDAYECGGAGEDSRYIWIG